MKVLSVFGPLSVISLVVGLVFSGVVVAQDDSAVFAEVDEATISQTAFDSAFRLAARQRFFHTGVAAEKVDALRVEVAQDMIDKLLLLKEVRQRSLSVAPQVVDLAMNEERKRFRIDHMSDEQQAKVMSMLRAQTEEALLLERLEAEVKSVAMPSEDDVRNFYQHNADKFTTPEQVRVSVILLSVAPSAAPEVWQAAHDEALRLLKRLRSEAEPGARFAELAVIHSGDSSAENGGDLGFVHQGMLSPEAQAAVDVLAPDSVSEPVMLLQGVALFRVTERKPAELNSFESVRSRAKGLLVRERSAFAWNALLETLRTRANIVVHDDFINKKIKNKHVLAGE